MVLIWRCFLPLTSIDLHANILQYCLKASDASIPFAEAMLFHLQQNLILLRNKYYMDWVPRKWAFNEVCTLAHPFLKLLDIRMFIYFHLTISHMNYLKPCDIIVPGFDNIYFRMVLKLNFWLLVYVLLIKGKIYSQCISFEFICTFSAFHPSSFEDWISLDSACLISHFWCTCDWLLDILDIYLFKYLSASFWQFDLMVPFIFFVHLVLYFLVWFPKPLFIHLFAILISLVNIFLAWLSSILLPFL